MVTGNETTTAATSGGFQPFVAGNATPGSYAAAGKCSQCKTGAAKWTRLHGKSVRAYCESCKARAEGQAAVAPLTEMDGVPRCACGLFAAHYQFTDAKGKMSRVCFVCGTMRMDESRAPEKDRDGKFLKMSAPKGKLVRITGDLAVSTEDAKTPREAIVETFPMSALLQEVGFTQDPDYGWIRKETLKQKKAAA